MKKLFTPVIIILIITALVLGYFIFQQRVSSQKDLPTPISSSPLETPGASTTTSVQETTEKEFSIFIGPNTQIIGVDQNNPYKGEPPLSINIGPDGPDSPDLKLGFEIFGNIFEIDIQVQAIRVTIDDYRDIDSEFTPRGPRILLEDIKEGERIVAKSTYNEDGGTDLRDIEFIQILPPK